jgi:hypothetical protein
VKFVVFSQELVEKGLREGERKIRTAVGAE